MRTIICAMIGYALFYFIRKNLAVALPSIETDLGISKVQLGVFLTLHGLILFLSIWNAASDGYGIGNEKGKQR